MQKRDKVQRVLHVSTYRRTPLPNAPDGFPSCRRSLCFRKDMLRLHAPHTLQPTPIPSTAKIYDATRSSLHIDFSITIFARRNKSLHIFGLLRNSSVLCTSRHSLCQSHLRYLLLSEANPYATWRKSLRLPTPYLLCTLPRIYFPFLPGILRVPPQTRTLILDV